LADTRSAATLADGLGLARCLAALAEWSPRPAPPTAIGASAFRSTLGQRVQRLLTRVEDAPAGEGWRVWLPTALILLSLFLPRATPRAPLLHEDAAMRSPARFAPFTGGLALLAGLAGLPAPAAADDPVAVKSAGEEAAGEEATVSEIPESVVGFF